MHEFSLAIEVINLAERETERNKAEVIQEITIEVGDMSGVEADAFGVALELLVKDSILDGTRIRIIKVPGKGKCIACNLEFEMTERMATCPECHSYPSEIEGGQVFRVVDMVVE